MTALEGAGLAPRQVRACPPALQRLKGRNVTRLGGGIPGVMGCHPREMTV